MLKDIVIIGAGGHAKEIAFLIDAINLEQSTWNLLGFIEKEPSEIGRMNGRYSVVADESFFKTFQNELNVVVAIGNPQKVRSIYSGLMKEFPNLKFPNLIHPSINIDPRDLSLEIGNIICAGNIFTTDISIGSFNCLNRACNISHDVKIGDFCTINPGANISGGVNIQDACLIGTGSTILQYLTVGESSIVGAGAVVIKDVLPKTMVVGVPAKEH